MSVLLCFQLIANVSVIIHLVYNVVTLWHVSLVIWQEWFLLVLPLFILFSCFLCTNYYNFKTAKNNIEGYFILKVDVMEKYFYFFLMFLFCVCGFVDFISLMIFGCTCSYNMSASERWIFEMKEGLKNKRITKKWIKRITDICSPQNTKGVGNLGSFNIWFIFYICRVSFYTSWPSSAKVL